MTDSPNCHRVPLCDDWTPEPHPWCQACCCLPADCTCPEVPTVPPNVELGTE